MNKILATMSLPLAPVALVIGALAIASCQGTPVQEVPAASVAIEPPPPKPVVIDARSAIFLGSDGRLAGTGAPSSAVSEVVRLGQGPRPQALAAAGLPKDKFGLIDWVAMVNKETIAPIHSLQPDVEEVPPMELDVLIEAKGDFVNNVLFRHQPHNYWLACENCHDGIFNMDRTQNKMSMVEISQGQWCGRCHGKVSFPLTDCVRCHSQPKVAGVTVEVPPSEPKK